MGKLILLVDDSATVQQLVRLAFEDEGIEVVSAGTVLAARDCLNVRTPHLILADASLPDGDAVTFLREVRARADTSQLPVVLLASASSPLKLEHVHPQAADAVLSKPFESMTLLVETVKDLLKRSPIPRPAPINKTTSGRLLDEPQMNDSILELDDDLEWPGPDSTSHPNALLASLPPGFVEEVADRVVILLLARLRDEVFDGSLPESVKAVVELITTKPANVESKTSGDIDELEENPDD